MRDGPGVRSAEPERVAVALEPGFDFLSGEYRQLFEASGATAFQHPAWLDAFYRTMTAPHGAEKLVVAGRDAADRRAAFPSAAAAPPPFGCQPSSRRRIWASVTMRIRWCCRNCIPAISCPPSARCCRRMTSSTSGRFATRPSALVRVFAWPVRCARLFRSCRAAFGAFRRLARQGARTELRQISRPQEAPLPEIRQGRAFACGQRFPRGDRSYRGHPRPDAS